MPQTGQALVLQFGAPVRIVQMPGLHLKVPLVQQLVRYDQRVLSLDPPEAEVLLADQKRVIVNAFLRYEIVDPLQFHRRVGSENLFDDRFGRLLNAAVRGVVAQNSLVDLLSPRRAEVMGEIVTVVQGSAADYGIRLVDIRISRSELTDDIQTSVFSRMRSERERQSELLRAEGEEVATRVRAQADRQQIEIVAEAQRESAILRGTGDAQRNLILGEAYGAGPGFFDFYRSLEAYRDSIGPGDTVVLSPRGDFFRYFRQALPPGRRVVSPPRLDSPGQTPNVDEATPIL